jgi:hypothetical protein
MAWLMDDAIGPDACDLRVLEDSHRIVPSVVGPGKTEIDMRLFRLDTPAVDSHIALWLRRMPPALQQRPAKSLGRIAPGSVLLCDPYLMLSQSINTLATPHLSQQFLIVSQKDAQPSVQPFTWVRDWRSSSLRVDFAQGVVFPKLHPPPAPVSATSTSKA